MKTSNQATVGVGALLLAAALIPDSTDAAPPPTLAPLAQGRSQFTKVTTGPVVTDRGSTFSSAWGDYDEDGFIDLVVGGAFGERSRLYRNNGDGTFAKFTKGDLATTSADATSTVWADYDNDGNLDLFAANYEQPRNDFRFRNNGDGSFTSITTGDIVEDFGHAIGAAWADYNLDGWLDLFVANVNGENDFLYRNRGDGGFERTSEGPPVDDHSHTQGTAWGDFDNDGDPDLFVGNSKYDSVPNDFLYRNDGNGEFTRIESPPALDSQAATKGVAWGDYDNDGDLDLVAVTDDTQNDRLYKKGDGTFVLIEDEAVSKDGAASYTPAWADYDNDGWLDLFVTFARGGLNRLYHNNRDGTFTRVTEEQIAKDGRGSYGCSWGDYDNDGFLDLFVNNADPNPDASGPISISNYLYHNNGNANG